MHKGKNKCKILKQIRKQIAEANDIEYVVNECQYKGDCAGTCPKCEAEVRYLEAQLNQRRLLGKAVVIAGISAGIMSLSSCYSCSSPTNPGTDACEQLEGDVAPRDTIVPIQYSDSVNNTSRTMGEVPAVKHEPEGKVRFH